ncbi:hypothetical protein MPTK1_4g18260 [Marchantia polymorpha subsp. ruderalis]|uniref:F-box domain-containing protein n=2 Tax=Marchantia polymorpha TaxID=3197 RepID=A0AAF6BB73_MARPO|nr:hypothetical protein MARPO_0041s0107 [Marchantia polymorpha]BBN09257.1 hypothetical protein Mp_4g18260 [Marchantia polymorpha subsp. ruderalis]|eukprot:PTQ40245.1 hypothetical protein MARPO_0041s0107 [Marchantia polymorpha]
MVLETEESPPGDPWETLPIEILIKVLRDHGLPVSTLVECRLVSKNWMGIVDGPDLRNKIWNKSVIVYDASTDGTAYFCCSDQWITRHITFASNLLVAADGGLLCFNKNLSTEFVLYNPVPDKFLTLNVPHAIPTVIDGMMKYMVVGLVVDPYTKHFWLLLGGILLLDERRSLIYDSETDTWSWVTHPFPPFNYRMEYNWRSVKGVECDGFLHWLVWDPRYLIKALLMFDLEEEKWYVLLEKVEMDKPRSLQMAAYEGHVCLLAMDWLPADGEFDYRSYRGAFLRNPVVRAMDRALIGRTRDLWVGGEGRPFHLYTAGGSDAFFVFDEEYDDLEVAKYWAQFDVMFFLPDPPFREDHEFRFWRILPPESHDPWCAIIPTPGVNAELEWVTQPQEELLEDSWGEDSPEAQAGGEEVQEGPGNEEAVALPGETWQL